MLSIMLLHMCMAALLFTQHRTLRSFFNQVAEARPLQEEVQRIKKHAQELQAAQAAFAAKTAAMEADLSAREAAVVAAQSIQTHVGLPGVMCVVTVGCTYTKQRI